MCSNEPDELIEMLNKSTVSVSDVCRKCQATGSFIVLRETDVYCNSCFLSYFVHKFRSTIGKSKQIKPKDRLLIGFSGGKNSTVLLNLIRQGLDESSHKKLRFDPSFIHVNGLDSQPFDSAFDVCEHVSKMNFPCYYVQFEEVFSPNKLEVFRYGEKTDTPLTSRGTAKDQHLEKFQKLLSKIKSSTTTMEDTVSQMRNELICRCAKQLGFKKVFLGENGTNLSVRILTDIALGRGSQLSGHVHFKSNHFDIEVYRPMRELMENEVEYYININNIKIPFRMKLENSGAMNSSIISCTKNFVLGLQKDFPATVPTIFRTGDKLIAGNFNSNGSVTSNADTSVSEISDCTTQSSLFSDRNCIEPDRENLCIFCGFIKDTNQGISSAMEAVNVSRLMSSLQPPTTIFSRIHIKDNRLSVPGSDDEDLSNVTNEDIGQKRITEEAIKYMCYGCRNILKEIDSVECLPARFFEDFNLISQRRANPVIIEDYFL